MSKVKDGPPIRPPLISVTTSANTSKLRLSRHIHVKMVFEMEPAINTYQDLVQVTMVECGGDQTSIYSSDQTVGPFLWVLNEFI